MYSRSMLKTGFLLSCAVLKLEDESKVLRDVHAVDVEVPGQYFSDQVRRVEDSTCSTFLEVYDNCGSRNDKELDLPITYFKQQLNQARSGQISPEGIMDLRLQAYNDSIFSRYMYKILPTGNHMWAFKKQFAIQLAVSRFMPFMLQIGGRSPNKILFAKNNGKIFQTDFRRTYDVNGMIEFSEPVPLRLTRNMQAFFSQFGVEGLILSAMCSAARAVVSPKLSCFAR